MVQRYSESRGIGVKWCREYRGSWGAEGQVMQGEDVKLIVISI